MLIRRGERGSLSGKCVRSGEAMLVLMSFVASAAVRE